MLTTIILVILLVILCLAVYKKLRMKKEHLELCHGPYRAKETCLGNPDCRWSGCIPDPSLPKEKTRQCSKHRMDDCINDDNCFWDGCRDKIVL